MFGFSPPNLAIVTAMSKATEFQSCHFTTLFTAAVTISRIESLFAVMFSGFRQAVALDVSGRASKILRPVRV
jgi:hypothetical protein